MVISGTDWLEVPIPYIFGLFFRPKFQDSGFPGTLWSKSWIQPLDSRFKIQDSQELSGANLESNPRIQDSRFKIPRNSLEQILNPSWILDSRFPAKSPWESWILNPGFKICWKESPGILNLESWIQGLDSRFAQKSLWESWILNPGFKICWKESVGILNLESIQLAMALQRHCKLDRCQRSQGSKKVGLGGGGTIYIYIYIYIVTYIYIYSIYLNTFRYP